MLLQNCTIERSSDSATRVLWNLSVMSERAFVDARDVAAVAAAALN